MKYLMICLCLLILGTIGPVRADDAPGEGRLSRHDSGRESTVLTFHLDSDPDYGIEYFGRLNQTAEKGDMTRIAEQPVRILARTNQKSLFVRPEILKDLTDRVVRLATGLVPKAETIYFFGTDQADPSPEDIFFFAEIDLSGNRVTVRRRPTDVSADPVAIPKPKEIRREGGVPLMRIIPEKPADNVVPDNPKPLSAEVRPTLPVKLPESRSSPVLDKIPHLLTSSRLSDRPIDGRALVHVARFDGPGVVVIDQPVPLRAHGLGLSLGWGVAEGRFFYRDPKQKQPSDLGFLEITSFSPVERTEFRP